MTDRGSASAQQPRGHLRLVIQRSQLARGGESPSVVCDGSPVPTVTGENLIEVSAGAHVIEVTASQRTTPVRYEVDIADGQLAELWYAPPFARSSLGTIGPRPQPDHAMRYLTLLGILVAIGVVVARLW